MLVIAAIVVLLLGLIGLILSLRGRRIDDHPLCRACRFDLTGIYPGQAVCPECGRALNDASGAPDPRAVRIGTRRIRTAPAILSSFLLIAALAAGGFAIWDARGGNWNANKPTWWLMFDTSSSNLNTVEAALLELKARRTLGKLPAPTIKSLIERALAAQADQARPWADDWGEIIEDAWTKNSLTDEQKKSYADHAVTLTLRARSVVRQGDKLAAIVDLEPRVGPLGLLSFDISLPQMTLGDQPLLGLPFRANGGLDTGIRFGGSLPKGMPAIPRTMHMEFSPETEPIFSDGVEPANIQQPKSDAKVKLAPGDYELKSDWKLSIHERATGGSPMQGYSWGRTDPAFERFGGNSPFGRPAGPLISEHTVPLTARVKVVPPDARTVELVTDPALEGPVRAAITVTIADEPAMSYRAAGRRAHVSVMNAPIDLAFDVSIKCAGGERHGHMLSNMSAGMSWGTELEVPGGPSNNSYEVTLTPNIDRACRSVTMTRIWGKPIVFENVVPGKSGYSIMGTPAIAVTGGPSPSAGSSGAGGEAEVMASLKLPSSDRFPGNHAFRSVALKMPMVYVGDRAGDIYIFKAGETDRDTSLSAIKVLKKAGDGNDLKVIGDVLMCTKSGRLSVFSLKNPEAPEPLGSFGPRESALSESLIPSGDTLYMLGRNLIRAFDISEPEKPSEIDTLAPTTWPRSGCIRANRLYATVMGPAMSTSVEVYDISEPSDIKRLGLVPLAPTPCSLHLLEGNRLLAVLDAPSTTLNGPGPWGSTAIINVKDPAQPRIVSRFPDTGGRASAFLTTPTGTHYLAVPGAVMRLGNGAPTTILTLYSGANLDGAAYHGDSDATHLAVVSDDTVVIVHINPGKAPAPGTDPAPAPDP